MTICILLASGCRASVVSRSPAGTTSTTPYFRDEVPTAGITFRLGHGGKSPLDIRETIGAGCALLDFDHDGWLDILLVGQTGTASNGRCALYRNRGDGRFEDVTARSGLGKAAFWTGCATGDWDGDGRVDLLLTGDGATRLYRNEGGPTTNDRRPTTEDRRPRTDDPAPSAQRPAPAFRDVTAESGIRVAGWATSAAFADVDGDGDLDLYVARYIRFGPNDPRLCQVGIAAGTGEVVQGACGPEVYDPEVGLFFRNLGGGRFREETDAAGLADAHGRGLGVAFGDVDGDGRPDLYVANDRMPGDLFRNLGNGRFTNIGVASGTAYSGGGVVQGGMGVEFADIDDDRRLDLFVTTFYREPKSLYRNLGGNTFEEIGQQVGIGPPATELVAFGTRFFDLENDGHLDLAFVNGHVVETAERVDRAATYRQRSLLFRRQSDGSFREATDAAGPDFLRPIVGRGLAVGDWDNDGLADLLATDLEGAPLLLHNEGVAGRGHWLGLDLRTARGAPALGARVVVRAGDRSLLREVTTGGSYLSASDPRLRVGLGDGDRVDSIDIAWPSGARQTVRAPSIDRYLTLRPPGASRRSAPGGDGAMIGSRGMRWMPQLFLAVAVLGCARETDLARLSTPALEARMRERPADTAAADALGERYVKAGRAREAEAVLAAAATRAPNDARLQNHLGVARAMLADRRGARTAFDRAIALDPALATARENRARLALEEGDLAAALTHTREAARLKPGDPEAQERLGDLLVQLRDHAAAASAYAEWARLRPQSADAWSALGAASLRADRFREAVGAFRTLAALRALTADEETLLGLALAEDPADAKEADEAERLLRAAIAGGRSSAAALYGLGLLASRAGRWGEAVICFRGAVAADAGAERPRYRLARALLKAGRRAEAERELVAYDRLFRQRRQGPK